jgi:MoaA/NifB/PqqE/SkfB family radical SAM enzyme
MNNFLNFYKAYVDNSTRINVDSTYICPLECPLCARQQDPNISDVKNRIKQGKHLSVKNFNKLIKKYKSISFVGTYSDSIYNPYFLEFIKIASKSPAVTFSISTNGTRKKPEWWKEVFSYSTQNIKWVFGLDGTNQEIANIYRVNTRYDEVMDVMKLGVSMGARIEWQFIVFKHNEHQVEEAKLIAKENKIIFLLCASSWWGGNRNAVYNIQPPENKDLYSTKIQSKFIRIMPI